MIMFDCLSFRPVCRSYVFFIIPLLFTGLVAGCAGRRAYMDGWYHLEAGQYEAGINELHKAVDADPQNTRYRMDWINKRDEVTNTLMHRASKALITQNFDAARQIYQTILAYDETNTRSNLVNKSN